MFPLAHNLLIVKLLKHPKQPLGQNLSDFDQQLLKVGSVLPDLVSAMDMDRNFGHTMGKDLYAFVSKNYPAYRPLALGAWLHGADPCGFDYYADEAWQDGLGWCFQKAAPFQEAVQQACNLPPQFSLWKAHNFIEMAAELEVQHDYPNLGQDLLAARRNPKIQEATTSILVEFSHATPNKVSAILTKVSQIFALQETTAQNLATKYANQLTQRHGITGANVAKMAELLITIQETYAQDFWQWLEQVEGLIIANLEKNQVSGNKKCEPTNLK